MSLPSAAFRSSPQCTDPAVFSPTITVFAYAYSESVTSSLGEILAVGHLNDRVAITELALLLDLDLSHETMRGSDVGITVAIKPDEDEQTSGRRLCLVSYVALRGLFSIMAHVRRSLRAQIRGRQTASHYSGPSFQPQPNPTSPVRRRTWLSAIYPRPSRQDGRRRQMGRDGTTRLDGGGKLLCNGGLP